MNIKNFFLLLLTFIATLLAGLFFYFSTYLKNNKQKEQEIHKMIEIAPLESDRRQELKLIGRC